MEAKRSERFIIATLFRPPPPALRRRVSGMYSEQALSLPRLIRVSCHGNADRTAVGVAPETPFISTARDYCEWRDDVHVFVSFLLSYKQLCCDVAK